RERVADLGGAAGAAALVHIGHHGLLDGSGLLGHAQVVQEEGHREDGGRGVCLLLAGVVRGRAVHRFELRGYGAVRVDVDGGRQADAAGDGGRKVGDDVAEEVIGDNHVKSGGVGSHEDGGRIHVQVVDGDLGVLGRDGIHRAAPQVTGVDQHVVLVHEGE